MLIRQINATPSRILYHGYKVSSHPYLYQILLSFYLPLPPFASLFFPLSPSVVLWILCPSLQGRPYPLSQLCILHFPYFDKIYKFSPIFAKNLYISTIFRFCFPLFLTMMYLCIMIYSYLTPLPLSFSLILGHYLLHSLPFLSLLIL